MPKKNMTPEERKAFGEKMRLARESKKTIELENKPDIIESDQDVDSLKAQIAEMKENFDLLKRALLNNQPQPNQAVGVGQGGKLVGEVEKYLVDPSNYPDPLPRLKEEKRLLPLAFDYNYELSYKVEVSSYQTQSGVHMKEPKFTVSLRRIILDDQGKQTNRGYLIQNYVFHEDPQTAMILAREQGIDIDQSDERTFLNEMRYLRVRDWLFGCFWPIKEENFDNGLKEEVIGGQLVQVYTRSSLDSTGVDFDQIKSKLRV